MYLWPQKPSQYWFHMCGRANPPKNGSFKHIFLSSGPSKILHPLSEGCGNRLTIWQIRKKQIGRRWHCLISDPCSSPMMFTDPKSYENPPKMCQKRAKTAGLSENQPKKLFLQNSPTEMGKIQEMYCHICQDIISSLPQTALSRVEILLSNGVSRRRNSVSKNIVIFL